ncbi:MAG: HD-GYP domain-containing protein, partial [Cetobacterium sp.]|uniref:HD-GYP domain-containing protein n=1 Tax=Cetobacterium sp. TaxID=2071632 RepID=UPI002FC9EAB4
GHSLRVALYSEEIAMNMGMSEQKCHEVSQIASLHDVGKIGVPDAILKKRDALSDEEYKIMKTHTTLGANILKGFNIIDEIELGALYHHERYDGKGYPVGLKGEEIPLIARIICVADAFDAMISNRCYHQGQDINEIKKVFKKCSGSQFDPKIVDIFLNIIENKEKTAEWLI